MSKVRLALLFGDSECLTEQPVKQSEFPYGKLYDIVPLVVVILHAVL
jgi:hypothetical protein